ncbi:hypothetical protein O181_051278 [Austropuccinia psidii MF-1]|uniref:Geranylgeranyl transferase type-2 subunit alpha n=1 Tax=Austropuccinia psidii MF-1 TaxID=1389203 RepID=A0A9Q3E0N5_9BASI|nr:hypothetical protein [Austropuccinia psidii MF-1]
MMMHGVKRAKADSAGDDSATDPEAIAEEKARLEEYKLLNGALLNRHALQQYSENDSLPLSAAVLKLNPEHVTAWSFRRHCLLALRFKAGKDDQQFEQALKGELPITLASFERNPKAYPIWEHRKWVLGHLSLADWNAELKLLERFLKIDGRNFHAWDYRRYIISKLKQQAPSSSLNTEELNFSARQIESNFSNFSAWHYRSKLLEPELTQSIDQEENQQRRLIEELEWVRGALWIDPNDQSAWLYHRWLMSHTRNEKILSAEIHSIEELLEINY